MIIETNYVTQRQFKEALKEVADKGQRVWCLMGRLQAMFGLAYDKETDDLMNQLIDNDCKENK